MAADALSKLASSEANSVSEPVYIEEIFALSIDNTNVILNIQEPRDWRSIIKDFILNEVLPEDKHEANKLKRQVHKYCIIEGNLYKRAFSSPLLLCIGLEQAQYAMKEIHEGIYGQHLGGKNLAFKILRQGYYWNTMKQDCLMYVKKCDACQRFGPISKRPTQELISNLIPIPFSMWGIDLIGPLPKAQGKLQFLVVAVDYTTKWIEAKPLARIKEINIIHFIMEYIIFRFGVPKFLVFDNGTQFVGKEVEASLEELSIQHAKASVAYPESNVQAEVSNRTILHGLERRVLDCKIKWVDELPNILWAYRTTPRTATWETPFKMTYCTEALLPIEIGIPTLRTENYELKANEEGLHANLDLIDELQDKAYMRMAQYQQKAAQHYNKKVHARQFQKVDLVLKLKVTSKDIGKLTPLWKDHTKLLKSSEQQLIGFKS